MLSLIVCLAILPFASAEQGSLPTIGVIGAGGTMGRVMTEAFAEHHFPVHAWNRTPGKIQALQDKGVIVEATLQELLSHSDIVFSMLTSYEATAGLFQTPDVEHAFAGKTLVDLATLSPDQARANLAWAERHDIRYLDGVVLCGPADFGRPHCPCKYSGPQEIFHELEPIINTLGGAQYLGESIGFAAAMDHAQLTLLYGYMTAFYQSMAIIEKEGLPKETLLEDLKTGSDFLVNLAMNNVRHIEHGSYDEEAHEFASNHVHEHALALIAEACEQGKYGDCSFIQTIHHLIRRLLDEGHGSQGLSAIFEILRAHSTHHHEEL
eukprot:m.57821 g.57821  ORF g.57821 m.57821 type:complete len:322 (+) comp18931_c0_seq1:159-1124(+)